MCKIFEEVLHNFIATGAKDPFSTIYIFGVELSRPQIVGLESKHFPDCASQPLINLLLINKFARLYSSDKYRAFALKVLRAKIRQVDKIDLKACIH